MSKYTYNTEYFKNIQSEEQAYWLGFICADGYLNKRGNTVGICLSYKDRDHLEKFKRSIKYTGNIFDRESRYNEHYKFTKKSTIEIYSTKLSKDLNSLGLDYDKSHSLKSVQVPKELIHHFIRGYFDGDGCVFEYSSKSTQYNCGFTFVGTKDFLDFINSCLPEKCKTLILDKRTKCTYTLYLASMKRFLIIKEYLYEDATVYLDRKFNKCNVIEEKIRLRKVQRLEHCS